VNKREEYDMVIVQDEWGIYSPGSIVPLQ
jgi:hypothetical protein